MKAPTNEELLNYLGMDNKGLKRTFGINVVETGLSAGKVAYKSKLYANLADALTDTLSDEELRSYRLEEKLTVVVKQQPKNLLPTTTALEIPNREIDSIISVVGAEVVYGHNFFKEMATGARDLVGGRSKSVQKTIAESRKQALTELQQEARGIGADAVISVQFTYTNIGGAGGVSVLVAATGTAVKLASWQAD